MGFQLQVSKTEEWYDTIEWYRNYINYQSEEQIKATILESVARIRGAKSTVPRSKIQNLYPKPPPTKMGKGSKEVARRQALVVLLRDLLEEVTDPDTPGAIEAPRVDWVKHCKNDFQILISAIMSASVK